MDRKIKLIWDFRGPTALKTAEHYEKHLREYILFNDLKYNISGHAQITDAHSMVYIVVAEHELEQAKSDLRPQRGEVFEASN